MSAPPKKAKHIDNPSLRATYQRIPNFIEYWNPRTFWVVLVLSFGAISALTWWVSVWLVLLWVVWLGYLIRGVRDLTQPNHAVLRNFPVLGHLRYILESLRPEIRQYFVESDHELTPFSREFRSVAYQRAKQAMDTMPFGTRHDVYEVGHEWLNHSLLPVHVNPADVRVTIGGPDCTQPYSASIFNISAMSFGSLSKNAVEALNLGAKKGGFYHNTGEGGLSPYHLRHGGDLVWQIGTGYFGCRAEDGGFDPEKFKKATARDAVKMIEIKLSQGAKPGHGGILPAAKVTKEISEIRGVPMGKDVLSPGAHVAFDTAIGLCEFVATLRELSGVLETGITPDFITVDGAEGGTGAAPVEFSNSVGTPLTEGLVLLHDTLTGAGLRDRITIISAGKITTGFHVLRQLALGADVCNSARGMMFALGCIQALKCNTNKCPVGVATQKERLMRGLVVPDKAERVFHFHEETVEAVCELVGAAGINAPKHLRRYHLMRRVTETQVLDLEQIYPSLRAGCLMNGDADARWKRLWEVAEKRMRRTVHG
jgi:glutamate synthase domain-containing protein 2